MERLVILDDLYTFAKDFSANYKTLSEGRYTSPKNNYCLDYIFGIKHPVTNEDARVTFRVGDMTGKIQADKAKIYNNMKITSNFVFFMIIWCATKSEHPQLEYTEVDALCTMYYLRSDMPSSDLLAGFKEVQEIALGKTTDRYVNILKVVANYKAGEITAG